MNRLALWLVLLLLELQSALVASAPFDPFSNSGIEQKAGAQAPLSLRLKDQTDRIVTLGQLLHDRPALLVPVYFRCPNVCGTQLSALFQMLDGLDYRPGTDFEVIVYSFDPRETPDDARAERERLARRWPDLAHSPAVHLLTSDGGSSRTLSEALGYGYRYDPQRQQYAHVSAIATLTADGRLSRWLYGLGYQRDDLRLALTEAGQGRIGDLGDQVLLLCYHYDPQTGAYSSVVVRALQVGGGATVLLLGGFIALSLRRERRRRSA